MGARGRTRVVAAAASALVVLLVALAGASASAAEPLPWNPLERQEIEPDTLYLLDVEAESLLPAGNGGLLQGNARSGGQLWQSTSLIVPTPGRFRTGLQSNGGVHAFAWMPAPDILPANEFTVEGWFKTTLRRWSVQAGTLLRIGDAPGAGFVRLHVGGGNITLELQHQQSATGPVSAQIVYPIVPDIQPGTWINLAFTFDAGRLRLYVNGASVGEVEVQAPRLWTDTASVDGLSLLGNTDNLSAGGFAISDLRISREARVPGAVPAASGANVLTVDKDSATGAAVNQRLLGVLHSLTHLATFPLDESLAVGTIKVIRTDKMLTATPMIAGGPDATHPTPGRSGSYAYDWQVVDRTLDYFERVGVEPILSLDASPSILGGSVNPFSGSLLTSALVWQSSFPREVPNDFTAWATIASDLVHHVVNERGDNVRYWGLWNEADISGFWTGTLDDYLNLYEATVTAVKAVAPGIKFGGPESANWNPAWTEALIRRAGERSLPLDFVSWHHYDGSLATISRARAMVDYWSALYGVPRPELAVGEFAWANQNAPISGLAPWRDFHYYLNDWNPAYITAGLIEMQRAGVAYMIGRSVTDVGERGFRANGYFGPGYPWGNGNAAYLWRDLAPDVVASTYSGRPGVFSLASKGDDGRITILVSNLRYRHQVPDDPLTIRVPGLPASRTVTHYVIDAEHSNRYLAGDAHANLETVAPPAWSAGGELQISLRPRSVHLIEITRPDTETALTTSTSPAEYGQSVDLVAQVTSTVPPTGSVEFTIDGAVVASAPVDAEGKATLALPTLDVGDHSIAAQFVANDDFRGSAAAPITQTVVQASTTTALESTTPAAQVPYGTPLELVYVVDAAASTLTPTGAVQLVVDGVDSGDPATLDTDGRARFTPSPLLLGAHTISARYLGSAGFAESASSSVDQTVVIASTTTTLDVASTSFHNAPVTVTARVATAAPSTAAAPGTVEFLVDGTLRASTALVDGVATMSLGSIAIGTHTIDAAYIGAATHAPSTSGTATHTVANNTATTMTVEQNRGSGKIRLRASVTNYLGGVAAGTVDFYIDGALRDSKTIDATSAATWNGDVAAGSRTFSARYRGDAASGLDASASPNVVFTVATIR